MAIGGQFHFSATRYLYVAEAGNHCVRRIELLQDGRIGQITTVVGTGHSGFSEDGALARRAAINLPLGLADTPDGLCFVESGAYRVRRVDRAGSLVTLAGSGKHGFNGEARDARGAELRRPRGLCYYDGGDMEPRRFVLVDAGQVKMLAAERDFDDFRLY